MSVKLEDASKASLAKVVAHLIRMIQDSADVRYYVGGPLTTMRELLVAAIKSAGYKGDPLELLKPAPHHADERARVEVMREEIERLEELVGTEAR